MIWIPKDKNSFKIIDANVKIQQTTSHENARERVETDYVYPTRETQSMTLVNKNSLDVFVNLYLFSYKKNIELYEWYSIW